MGQGLQVWDENGVNLVDTDYRLTQIIGSVYTADLLANNAYVNGSIHVPQFTGLSGTKFFIKIQDSYEFNIRTAQRGKGTDITEYAGYLLDAKIEGNYIKWTYKDITPHSGNADKNRKNIIHDFAAWILWGVY